MLLIFSKCISNNAYFLLIVLILAGAAIGYIVTANTTMLTVNFLSKVAKTHTARIAALYNSVASASVPILAFVFGIAAKYISTAVMFIFSGAFCLIAGFIMFFMKDTKS